MYVYYIRYWDANGLSRADGIRYSSTALNNSNNSNTSNDSNNNNNSNNSNSNDSNHINSYLNQGESLVYHYSSDTCLLQAWKSFRGSHSSIWRKTKVVLVKVVSRIIEYCRIRIYICVMRFMVCVYT